jgi:ornithine cyclodeaminase/thiomorpholine-carboxylate dehydrogenase
MRILLLGEADVRRLLDLEALLGALADEFMALSRGQVVAPLRSEVAVPDAGLLLAMPAYRSGRKIAVKLVSVFHGNEALGIPSHQALICLFDPATGTPLALMDGASITAMRTAGVAALSTWLLARDTARVLAIVGAGVQGRAHLTMLPRVRDFAEVRIASLRLAHAEQLAAADPRACAVASVADAVRGADVVCLCTNSGAPVIELDWLAPGAHVTSVGYRPPGGELHRRVIEAGRLFVETRLSFAPPPAGCAELVGLDRSRGMELGEVLLGTAPGRQSAAEITVYKAMGHACEDMAAASLVYERALREAVGQVVEI